ncbi:hypothetical protein A2661_01375 [Candidatus Giovannonibacteria bacterium RIFCSPHIGHO2_01_FULL_45_24]|uniref:Transposase IS200-like domain-containing protein n=1 Tax=Candidatus Giovannonibacteria bacterium RIFCSPLOWO2_01_FULL_46_32 TaxID=1798353 RepID=A0A1F5XHR9_9BACT|nr:MAG: hypothetical protein A2661_01375 [Candidatus Giovannonibacteria bacterium RIFCSPHIGHO2_01_FULL_45_24]OGF87346.1 MAG: hypothetical protein A3B19_03970 [Candidatus Giovannonibacteria bacterium RIFCSPLOWO2_01_FULL_46_32]
MNKEITFEGEHSVYHIFSRGVEKRDIFSDDDDRNRFLFLLCALQGNVFFNHISSLAKKFGQRGTSALQEIERDIFNAQIVELIGFVLMPNHYHLMLLELQENGISKFMSRLGNSYTKYFNLKHKRNGYLFSSHCNKILVDTNEYLLHLSAYIHRNPRELIGWRNKESKYPWSSYQDYIGSNRFGNFINRSILLDQFSSPEEYGAFVSSSKAKDYEDFLANLPD